MKIAEFVPKTNENELCVFKGYQDGATSYAIAMTYNGEFMYKTEYSSFDSFSERWEQIKNVYNDNSRSTFKWEDK